MTTLGLFDRLEDQRTLSSGDSPASPSAMPGNAQARQMTATSGRKWLGSLKLSGPLGSLARMLLGSSRWHSTVVFLTWSALGTPARRSLYRLQLLEPSTAGIEPGLWPTPHANASTGPGTSGRQGGMNLQTAAHLWPTPDATMHKGARLLGTMALTGRNPLTNRLPDAVQATDQIIVGGSLNPQWVEWLMGYPAGWTDLGDSATPSSRRSSRKSGGP